MSYSVGQVAGFAGVTVRTLHHYGEIGLLAPSGRSAAGYRRYDEPDLERLQQVLFYRELGFRLEEIATILDEPNADAAAHLRRQHRLLTQRISRLQAMVAAVEHAMEAQKMGIALTPEERFDIFGDFDPEDYAEEAEQRWGGTPAWDESQRRAAAYDKQAWLRITAEGADIEQRFVAALSSGVAADSQQAMDLAEEYRQHITRWFYDCGYDIHRGLGDLYVDDARFRARYQAIAPGLAQFVRDANHANANRAAAG
ncbi:MAG: MerR family transcriptional regulator [Egibacteraceae bacterium]